MRRSTLAFSLIAFGAAALVIAALHAQIARSAVQTRMAVSAALVKSVGLTDLALFTEARYTRNPALADLHTAFQDSPFAFEHFPSGSFAPRPVAGWGQGTLGADEQEVRR